MAKFMVARVVTQFDGSGTSKDKTACVAVLQGSVTSSEEIDRFFSETEKHADQEVRPTIPGNVSGRCRAVS